MSQGNGENYIMRNLMICILNQYFSVDKIEKNEMGGASSANGGEERCIRSFDRGNLRERGHSGVPGGDGRIILR